MTAFPLSRRGFLNAKGKRFGIVVSRFNEFITRRLLDSAVETLQQAGVSSRRIEIVWVPGALEIPLFCRKLFRMASGRPRGGPRRRVVAGRRKFHALIALACILRGGTYHFECVSGEITRGISQVALETDIPIATGIITADTLGQAIDRAGLKSGNKGAQAALAAIEIADLGEQLA